MHMDYLRFSIYVSQWRNSKPGHIKHQVHIP